LQENIAYSLFGIFGIHLPVIYGEKKENVLGWLLQDVIVQSGDTSCLDWAGMPSEFNTDDLMEFSLERPTQNLIFLPVCL
jgi:hypothetical protein